MEDSRPRNFSYIDHKDSYPLEIKGNMKRRPRPQSSNNHEKSAMLGNSEADRKVMTKRIIENYQDLKSVIPFDLSNNKRKESIRIIEREKFIPVSGISYLMIKSNQEKNPQKRHLTEKNCSENAVVSEVERKQKKHFYKAYLETDNDFDFPKRHTETLNKKITDDLYSRLELKENMRDSTVKMSQKNMFTEGAKLGYEHEKQPRISIAKQKEFMGANYRAQSQDYQNKRSEWNRSSIVLG